MRAFVFVLFAFLTFSELKAQVRTPKYANEYLAIGVGARSFAMGNASIASIQDASASYWNPSRLTAVEKEHAISLMHAEYFAGIAAYDFIGYATDLDNNKKVGASLIRFGVDDIPDTRYLYDADGRINYDNIRFFSAADYAFLLSYAQTLNSIPNLSFGANAKILHRTAGDFATAWGFGFDFGLSFETEHFLLGLAFRDITGTFTAWYHNVSLLEEVYLQTGNDIPQNSTELTVPRAILGFAYQESLPYKLGFLLEMNGEITFDGDRNTLISSNAMAIDPRLGLELDYDQMAFLRFGLNNIQQIMDFSSVNQWNTQFNTGVGFRYKSFQLDYAYTDIGNSSESLYSHIFTLHIGWDAATK